MDWKSIGYVLKFPSAKQLESTGHKIFMFETKDSTSPKLSIERLRQLCEEMLRMRFPGVPSRQQVRIYRERLNLACPFCGDSHTDNRAKRGNLYPESMHYRCYNGGCPRAFTDAYTLFSENGVNVTKEEEREMKVLSAETLRAHHTTKAERADMSAATLTNPDLLKALVKRDDIMRSMGLWEIKHGSPQHVYLTKRRQVVDQKFAWDNRGRRLFIFNLDSTGEFVFGAQTRKFDDASGGSKYLTYNIKKIHTEWLRKTLTDEEHTLLDEMIPVSTLFGILTCRFGEMLTVFEGPMDSFLMDNAVATCSINNEWPFDMGKKRFMQDNDSAGAGFAFKKIAEGEQVFLWRKFIRENGFRGKKVKDLNDLRIIEFLTDKTYDLNKYFSNDRFDLHEVVSNDDTFGQVVDKTYKKKWKK